MKKLSRAKRKIAIIVALILYVGIGVTGFNYIKYMYMPEHMLEFDKYILEAVEINDIYGLNHVFNTGEDTYALISGEFTCDDSIYSKYYNKYFSYYEEVEFNKDEVISNNLQFGKRYKVYDTVIDGLNFDIIKSYEYETIKDIRKNDISYTYYVKNVSYKGTMLCLIKDNKVKPIDFYEFTTISEIKSNAESRELKTDNIFAMIWILGLSILIIGIDPYDNDDNN